MKKICYIVPYFGKLPKNMKLWLNSCKTNPTIDWLLYTDDKTVYDYAVDKLNSLKGDELLEFKKSYFGADPSELRWNKQILIYNAEEDSWRSIGEVPFDAPCGAGVVLGSKDKIYSINGEIKPGTRTNRTYSGTLFYK